MAIVWQALLAFRCICLASSRSRLCNSSHSARVPQTLLLTTRLPVNLILSQTISFGSRFFADSADWGSAGAAIPIIAMIARILHDAAMALSLVCEKR